MSTSNSLVCFSIVMKTPVGPWPRVEGLLEDKQSKFCFNTFPIWYHQVCQWLNRQFDKELLKNPKDHFQCQYKLEACCNVECTGDILGARFQGSFHTDCSHHTNNTTPATLAGVGSWENLWEFGAWNMVSIVVVRKSNWSHTFTVEEDHIHGLKISWEFLMDDVGSSFLIGATQHGFCFWHSLWSVQLELVTTEVVALPLFEHKILITDFIQRFFFGAHVEFLHSTYSLMSDRESRERLL